MFPTGRGSIRLFRLFGINVYLHWSWFLIALYGMQTRSHEYGSFAWNVLEYVALFSIVLLHEFGHALACRQVGGQADQIVLWPLGGVAYVSPPQRPGAVLWSIAAGPLVNVVLVLVFTGLVMIDYWFDWSKTYPNLDIFSHTIWQINLVLLFFNLLPVYPLDGGKILWALLWFVFGRARSLMIASILGFAGVVALIPVLISLNDSWLYVVAAFILLNCWSGFMQARELVRRANAPRRAGFACPVCRLAPLTGAFWRCSKCRQGFDTFETQAVCPHCGVQYAVTMCLECGTLRPIAEWIAAPTETPPPLP